MEDMGTGVALPFNRLKPSSDIPEGLYEREDIPEGLYEKEEDTSPPRPPGTSTSGPSSLYAGAKNLAWTTIPAIGASAGLAALVPGGIPARVAMGTGMVLGDVFGRWMSDQPQSLRDEIVNFAVGTLGVSPAALTGAAPIERTAAQKLMNFASTAARKVAAPVAISRGADILSGEKSSWAKDLSLAAGMHLGEKLGNALETAMTSATPEVTQNAIRRLGLENKVKDYLFSDINSQKAKLIQWISRSGDIDVFGVDAKAAIEALKETANREFRNAPGTVPLQNVVSNVNRDIANQMDVIHAARDITPSAPELAPGIPGVAGRIATEFPRTVQPQKDILAVQDATRKIAEDTSTQAAYRASQITSPNRGEAFQAGVARQAAHQTPPMAGMEGVRAAIGEDFGAAGRQIDTALGGKPLDTSALVTEASKQMDLGKATAGLRAVIQGSPDAQVIALATDFADKLTTPGSQMSAMDITQNIQNLRYLSRHSEGTTRHYIGQLEKAAKSVLQQASKSNPEARTAYDLWNSLSGEYRNAINGMIALDKSMIGGRVDPAAFAKAYEKVAPDVSEDIRNSLASLGSEYGSNVALQTPSKIAGISTPEVLVEKANEINPVLWKAVRANPGLENELVFQFLRKASQVRTLPDGRQIEVLYGPALKKLSEGKYSNFFNQLSSDARARLTDWMGREEIAIPRLLKELKIMQKHLAKSDVSAGIRAVTQGKSGVSPEVVANIPTLETPGSIERELWGNAMIHEQLPGFRETGELNPAEVAQATLNLREQTSAKNLPSRRMVEASTTPKQFQAWKDFGEASNQFNTMLNYLPKEIVETLTSKFRAWWSKFSALQSVGGFVGLPSGIARAAFSGPALLSMVYYPQILASLVRQKFSPEAIRAADAAGRALFNSLSQRPGKQTLEFINDMIPKPISGGKE